MYLLGYDIGSSSVKASLVDAQTGVCVATAFAPKREMPMTAVRPGWAEQDPDMWWDNLKAATREVLAASKAGGGDIKAIGISYQMHGLVCVDRNGKVLRPAIIWCDSRAVEIGAKAFSGMGQEKCLAHLLNSPGNFTASKLRWVRENEPDVYKKIHKVMLPGDYAAMRLSGEISSTVAGMSEGMFWDFKQNGIALFLLKHYDIDVALLPPLKPTFSVQGAVSAAAAAELGLAAGTPIAYRAGDQPNNAFSLNVLQPGEIAATAGTSGVVYGISDTVKFDPQSRVNTFAHVNHTGESTRLGVLLCINGTGILNSWIRRHSAFAGQDYDAMNTAAAGIPPGSDGLVILPFGNGAERMLGNVNMGGVVANINFNIHDHRHLARAAQEGIVFAFHHGMEIMKQTGIHPSVIRAGHANMFLSPVFRETLAGVSGAVVELYDTDGAQGAARGAGVGAGIYATFADAFRNLRKIKVVEPDRAKAGVYKEAYQHWADMLAKHR